MRGIICADLHLREDKPRCRTEEDFIKTENNILIRLMNECINRDCDLYLVGDIFHRSTEYKMVRSIQYLAEGLRNNGHGQSLYYICGNHDLLYHSSANMDKSAIGLLRGSTNCYMMNEYFRKDERFSCSNYDEPDKHDAEIVFKHILCTPEKNDFFKSVTAEELLELFPKADWIFTGDYHHQFHYEKNGRHVINPGCLIRQVSDMKDYECGYYYVDTDADKVEWIPSGDDQMLVDDSYILENDERTSRIDDFVSGIKDTEHISLDYIYNVNKSIKENGLSDELSDMIDELLKV